MKKILLILSCTLISLCTPSTFAADPTLTRSEAITLLSRYTPENSQNTAPSNMSFTDISDPLRRSLHFFCSNGALNCNITTFSPNAPISLPAFLKLTFAAAEAKYGVKLTHSSLTEVKEWHTPYIKGALLHGLIPAGLSMETITPERANSILKKIDILSLFSFYPQKYFKGLVPDSNQLQISTFASLEEAESALTHTSQLIQDLYVAENTSNLPLSHIAKIQKHITTLTANHTKLHEIIDTMKLHPLWYDTSYSEEDRKLFQEHGINEKLGEGFYDYHTNPGYRKMNIRNSIDNAHLQILQPDEIFSYWDTMWKRGGLKDVGNGWTISGGNEVWEWGGGLCGTATALFRGAWFGGLEIVQRRNHSAYYSSLYGLKEIGLDATVYSTGPDLQFKNNTGAPVMIYIKFNERKDMVWVQILGTKPFEKVENVGPTRSKGWYVHVRTITYPDGSTKSEELKSSYRKIY